MAVRKIFVETSVVLKIGSPVLSNPNWGAVVRRLAVDFEFVVSPLTFFEVLNRLAGGTQDRILPKARAFTALSPVAPEAPIFLDMPGQFILDKILCCGPIADTFRPQHLRDAMAIILDEQEASPELCAWLAEVRSWFDVAKQGRVEACVEMQKTGGNQHDQAGWLRQLFRQSGGILSVSAEEIDNAAHALNAAWKYELAVQEQLKNPQFHPTYKNCGSDWIDIQQLFYLSDPCVHILYLDRHFETRTKATSQRSQLIDIQGILAEIATTWVD